MEEGNNKRVKSVMFVCLGNINRSCYAEWRLRSKVPSSVEVESSGIGGHFAGSPASRGISAAARKHNVDMSHHRAKQITQDDIRNFDLILAMDRSVYTELYEIAPEKFHSKIKLFLLEYAKELGSDTPDPYYTDNYDQTVDIINSGIDGLLATETL